MKVLIVRDRESAGGGVHHYYRVVEPHLTVELQFSDVGKPSVYYGRQSSWIMRFRPCRLLMDWIGLAIRILRFRPDIVHVNPSLDPSEMRSLRRDAVNLLLARLLGRRVLVFWRGWENDWSGKLEFPGGNRSLLCWIYQQGAAHVVLAKQFKDDLRRWGFRTAIHVETTVVADDLVNALDKQGGLATDLLFLSRIKVSKGVYEMVEAYRILKTRNPAYTLAIVGDGPDLEALKKKVEDLDLEDVVFPGFVHGAAKVSFYRRGGTFCFLSYTEGMPNAVLEAMAMGLPVVSSDAGGLADILTDETGVVVRPREDAPMKEKFDPAEVAEKIDDLVRDDELHERIARHNTEYARRRFAAPEVARRLQSIYQSLAAGMD